MIVRELITKLGFQIDNAKLDRFEGSLKLVKSKMENVNKEGKNLFSSLNPNKNNILYDKSDEEFSKSVNEKFETLKKNQEDYKNELAGLSKVEKAELLALNKLEKQAISEVSKYEKSELREREKLANSIFKDRERRSKLEKRNYEQSLSTLRAASRKFAIIGAAIGATFALSLKSTLKDVENFKEGKSKSFFDKNQILIVDKFNRALNSTKLTITSLRNNFVIALLPAVKETLDVFNLWIIKNKVLIQEKLKEIVLGLAGGFKILVSAIKQVLVVIDFIIGKTIAWKTIISALVALGAATWFISLASSIIKATIAFKALSAVILTNPLTYTIALITAAFALLINEIYVTINGGDSLINSFLKSNAWVFCKNSIDAISDSFGVLWKWLIKVKDSIFNFPSKVLTNIKGILKVEDEDSLNLEDEKSKSLKKVLPIEDENEDKKSKRINSLKKALPDLSSLENAKHEIVKGLNVYSIPKYEPKEVSKILNSNVNNSKSANVTQKNSFNMNFNLPSGTDKEQAINISKLVKIELEKHQSFQNEKIFNAIGSY